MLDGGCGTSFPDDPRHVAPRLFGTALAFTTVSCSEGEPPCSDRENKVRKVGHLSYAEGNQAVPPLDDRFSRVGTRRIPVRESTSLSTGIFESLRSAARPASVHR
jgi:hypothetical protein